MSQLGFYRICQLSVRIVKNIIPDRYANKKFIIQIHLEVIFEFRPIKEESHYQLRKTTCNFMEITLFLQGIGLDVDNLILSVFTSLLKRRTPIAADRGGFTAKAMKLRAWRN